MNRVSRALAHAVVLASAGTLAGCSTPTITRDPERNVVGTNLDQADFQQAAANLTESLMAQGVFADFKESTGNTPVINRDTFVNTTSFSIRPSLLLNKIDQTIINSGLASPIDLNSDAGDEFKKQLAARGERLADHVAYTLKTEIIELRSDSATGRTQDRSYTIQMTLLDYSTSAKKWIGEEVVTKQISR